MIRRLAVSALIVLCVGLIPCSANAVKHTGLTTTKIIQPPGGTYGQPIRVTQVIYSGWNITRIVTETDPVTKCVTTTTTYYAFWTQTGETVETECPE